MVVNPKFWNGKRVLVTGHTGFKGSWCVSILNSLGANVGGFSLSPDTSPSLFSVLDLEKKVEHCVADVRDLSALSDFLVRFDPQVIIHMAAQPLVRASYTEPVETFATNVMGTVHILEAARRLKALESAVIVTTDKVYENKEWAWPYRETDTLGGRDPYAASKACAELVTSSYRNSFYSESPVRLFTARAGNVIGGGDWAADRLIPDLVRSATEGRSTEVRNPLAVRPWQHVLEPVCGYLRLAEKRPSTHAWNFGPDAGTESNVESVANRFCELWGKPAKWNLDPKAHPHESRLLSLDISQAKQELGWRPVYSVPRALDLTVKWYKAFYEQPKSVFDVTQGQIQSYLEESARA